MPINQKSDNARTLTGVPSFRTLSSYERENVNFTGVQSYPKDNTSGCTKEACSFRDANHEMQKRGVVVLGVSPDMVKEQLRAEKGRL